MAEPGRGGIRRLPAAVVNRIAAGEVVERPASVVKELVENALDAGAKQVEIEVREGGKALVRVVDDGGGMSAVDLELAFVAHATSKLTDVEDLQEIGTLGFRGEALASIGAVANARILTRAPQETGGWEVRCEYGRTGPVRPAASPAGTTVEVAGLFRNVPARSRFLKSNGAEMARVTEAVRRFGLSTPDVEFSLTHGGRPVVAYPLGMPRRERIAKAFGRGLDEELIEAQARAPSLALQAWLAPPSRTFADSTRMHLYLNGRFVKDRRVLHAIRAAYEGLIFGNRNPIAFVFLTMDPAEVDQNVHPAKLEVRFRDPGRIHSFVRRALREALTGADLASPVPLAPAAGPPEAAEEREGLVREALGGYLADRRGQEPAGRDRSGAGLFDAGPAGGGAAREARGRDARRGVDVLQVRNSFLVLEDEDGITIVDQHALHERILFDRIRTRYLRGEVPVQRLLRPAVVELPPGEVDLLLEARETLASLGVLVDRFGPDSVAVRGVPAGADAKEPAALVEDLAAGLAEERVSTREDLVHRFLATIACKAAVKAGDRLSAGQVSDLLAESEGLEHSHTCPHGRPTTLRIGYDALERHFRRKG